MGRGGSWRGVAARAALALAAAVGMAGCASSVGTVSPPAPKSPPRHLVVTPPDGVDVDLQAAARTLRSRLQIVGVSGEVQVSRERLVVTVPANAVNVVSEVTVPGVVQFRQVLVQANPRLPSPGASATPRTPRYTLAGHGQGDISAAALDRLRALTCPPQRADTSTAESTKATADVLQVACAPPGPTKLIVDRAEAAAGDVASAKIDTAEDLLIRFTDPRKIAQLTGRLVSQRWPRNQLAIDVDGRVYLYPTISEATNNGQLLVSGAPATTLREVAAFLSTPPLPAAFDVGAPAASPPATPSEGGSS